MLGSEATKDDSPREESRAPLSERLERSSAVQLLISAFVVLVLMAEVITHLPPSAMERELGDRANEVIRMIASEQAWGVFSPNPRSTSLRLEARITFADGSTDVWTVPEGSPVGSNLRYYRWRKWLERIRSDDFRGLWRPTAQWVADEHAGGPSPVARVELVRLYHDNVVSGEQPPWEEFTYYTLDVPEPAP